MKGLKVAANIVRGLLFGVLLCYALYIVVLRDAGAIITRYAGY